MSESNAAKMTVEERLVQRLKDDTVLAAITDEDALTKLAERAIKEAFFQPRRVPDGSSWGRSYTEKDSPVVEAARSVAEKMAKDAAERMLADPENQALLHDAIVKALPQVLTGLLTSLIQSNIQSQANTALMTLQNMRPGSR